MPVRLFGTVTMDDFKLDGEPNTNPTAIGSSVGIEWNVVPGEAFEGRDFSAWLLKRGSYYIDSPYDDEYKQKYDPFRLPGEVTSVIGLNVSAYYFPLEGLGLEASVSYTRDITHGGSAFKVYAGVNLALCEIDWRKMI